MRRSRELDIDVTESATISTELVMCLEKLNRRAKPFHVNSDVMRIYCTFHRHRHVRVNKWDSVKAILRVLHLPNPPETVQACVMEVEEGVSGRGKRITARVNSSDIVACGMDLISTG